MYQLEVKRYLVQHQFPPADGWEVTVDVDPMELDQGGRQSADKQKRAACANQWLKDAGVTIGCDPEFGRVDLVARKPSASTVAVEIEGDSSRQKEQSLYSALGQVLLQMRPEPDLRYGLAVPDTTSWQKQIAKIPTHICNKLSLTLWLVGKTEVREV